MERWGILCIALAIAGCQASKYQDATDNLKGKLSTALPLPDDGSPVNVNIAWQVLSIDEVDKSNNRVGLVVSKRAQWNDPELAWDAESAGISSLFADAGSIWTPDVAVYNAAAAEKEVQAETVLVVADGLIVSSASSKITAMCDVSGVDTYSGASCEIVLGSWAYRSEMFSLVEPTEDLSFFTASYSSTSKYEILSYNVRKEVRNYACCNYEAKYTQDVWVISFSFRERYGGTKKSKLNVLRSLLKD